MDGGFWAAISIWVSLGIAAVALGLFLHMREKRRGGGARPEPEVPAEPSRPTVTQLTNKGS